MKKETLVIEGLHCSSCELIVKESLEDTGKVKVRSIDHKSGKISFHFNGSISLDEIKEIIRKEGYEV